MQFDREGLDDELLKRLYREMLFPRLIEEKMLLLLRQGKISKWFSGIGQEAIAIGSTLALEEGEWILPLHRNLGVFTARGIALDRLLMQWQGSMGGYSKGRERSFHFGSREHHICGMISHLGPQLSVADGIALGNRLDQQDKVTLVFTGEGATSEGEFHEALNLAAVWELPVIFLIENNGFGLSTPVSEQYRCNQLSDRALGYGMEGMTIEGNNILEVYQTIRVAREYAIRNHKPVLVECMTFRMRGHEEASGTRYVPSALFQEWEKKDPVKNYEAFLLTSQLLEPPDLNRIHGELKDQIDAALQSGFAAAPPVADIQKELSDVYHPQEESFHWQGKVSSATVEKRFIDAISDGLDVSMSLHGNLILMGQDIAAYGGAFKITEGFAEKYGKERVRNTPLCESAVIGAALGLSIAGYRSVVEMQFADFVTCGFNQIVNNLAKIHYRWGQQAGVVIRMPTGGGVGAGPFHSQSNEAWFTHTPGLKVVFPSTPEDAKGLLLAAIEDSNPVMFFEHKALYRSISGPVPEGYYQVPIGKARIVCQGEDISILTYGAGVHWALEEIPRHPELSFDLIDLRTLLPLDYPAIRDSIIRTGKVLILHEDTLTGGIGGEIAAWISEHCFDLLDAPVLRCASLDTPVPFSRELEAQFLASNRLTDSIRFLENY